MHLGGGDQNCEIIFVPDIRRFGTLRVLMFDCFWEGIEEEHVRSGARLAMRWKLVVMWAPTTSLSLTIWSLRSEVGLPSPTKSRTL